MPSIRYCTENGHACVKAKVRYPGRKASSVRFLPIAPLQGEGVGGEGLNADLYSSGSAICLRFGIEACMDS